MKVWRDAALDALAEKIARRAGGCPVLLGVELASAAIALALTQADIDEAFRRAEALGLMVKSRG